MKQVLISFKGREEEIDKGRSSNILTIPLEYQLILEIGRLYNKNLL
jgi:hypothetical protein